MSDTELYNEGSKPVKFINLSDYRGRTTIKINASDIKEIDDGGRYTKIVLVGGKEITVSNSVSKIAEKMEKALSNPRSRAEVG